MCVQLAGIEDLEAAAACFHARRTMDELSSALVRPTDPAPAIILAERERRLGWMRWGFQVPDFKRAERRKLELHARGETAATKQLWRDSFARRRCAIIACGWWEVQPNPQGRGRGTPFFYATGQLLALAALWRPEGVGPCFTLVTMDAESEFRAINARNPALLDEAALARWLDPATPADELTCIASTRTAAVRPFRTLALGDPTPA